MTKKQSQIASEFLAELARNPEYQERRRRQDEEIRRRAEERARAEAPVVAALRAVGGEIDSVSDLVNTNSKYPELVPVLFDELTKPYPPIVRESLARALAVREARPYFNGLVRLYLGETDNSTHGPKWALHCAIATTADAEVQHTLIELARDRRHGENRKLFVDALARINTPETRAVLEELQDDPDLVDDFRRLSAKRKKQKRSSGNSAKKTKH